MSAEISASEAAKHGAQSVFAFVQRTAERVAEGVRWETLDYDNQPQYAARVFNGVGGIPWFLADYFRLTGEPAALDLAIGGARWCSTPARLAAAIAEQGYLRVGVARVALGWLRIAVATGDEAHLHEASLAALTRLAVPDRGGLNWPGQIGAEGTLGCQWCWGAPGIGLVYAKAYETLGDETYLGVAKAAGETTFAYGDVRQNPSQCHGLAGNAELFVELYRLTRDTLWLDRAQDFGRRCMVYRSVGPEGETWQADEAGFSSPDFMCGAAGTGHFFLRLLAPDVIRMPVQ